jgi:hypothetical protein
MFSQFFENFRKASESSLLGQQQLFKQWLQQWPSAPTASAGTPDWPNSVYKDWLEAVTEALNRHRELLDATYRNAIQAIEQTARISDAKSIEDYRRVFEDAWRQSLDTFKTQAEAQVHELQKLAERWRSNGHNAGA